MDELDRQMETRITDIANWIVGETFGYFVVLHAVQHISKDLDRPTDRQTDRQTERQIIR